MKVEIKEEGDEMYKMLFFLFRRLNKIMWCVLSLQVQTLWASIKTLCFTVYIF